MPNESEGPITVLTNDVASINLALGQILERLDTIKGLRGDPTVYAAVTVGAPGGQEQAARLADIPVESPTNILFWALAQKASTGPSLSPADFTDNSGGVASSVIAAMGGITALTDNSGGAANNTIAAITNANNAGSADVVPTADAIADLAAKVNALIADMDDVKNAFASIAFKINLLMARLRERGDLS